MGVFYSVVLPDAEIIDYLRKTGVVIADAVASRNPTPREVRSVCEGLKDVSVRFNSHPGKFWQAVLGFDGPPNGPYTILNINQFSGNENEPHAIWFEKGTPSLILRIVHLLSQSCGTLIVWPDTGDDPVVVTSSDSIDHLLRTWG